MAKLYRIIKYYDPTNEHCVFALKFASSLILGAIYWLYTRRPCSAVILMAPSILTMSTYKVPSLNRKLFNMLITSLGLIIGIISICMLINYKWSLILILFLLTLTCFFYAKLVFTTSIPWVLATFLTSTPGWQSAVDCSLEVIISFLLVLFMILFFELLTAKIIMRSSLIYAAELIGEAFSVNCCIDDDTVKEKIFNKHLLKKDQFDRTNRHIEDIYTKAIDKFNYKVTSALNYVDAAAIKEEYFFKSNFLYSNLIIGIYNCYLNLYRSILFLENFEKNRISILKKIPQMIVIIKEIDSLLQASFFALKSENNSKISLIKIQLIDNWIEDINNYIKQNNVLNQDELIVCYGIKCVLINSKALIMEINENEFNSQ